MRVAVVASAVGSLDSVATGIAVTSHSYTPRRCTGRSKSTLPQRPPTDAGSRIGNVAAAIVVRRLCTLNMT